MSPGQAGREKFVMTIVAMETAVGPEESNRSAVSWAAIAAGAVASAGFSLFLLELLAGLGLSVFRW
jgi:hypothetical protein